MPECKAEGFREPDGQYTWTYFRDGAFIEVGGQNLTLANAVNGARDKIAAEPNVTTATRFFLIAYIPA